MSAFGSFRESENPQLVRSSSAKDVFMQKKLARIKVEKAKRAADMVERKRLAQLKEETRLANMRARNKAKSEERRAKREIDEEFATQKDEEERDLQVSMYEVRKRRVARE
jgi:hypothetical protein